MGADHFQEEETYLFSSLLDRLKRLTGENVNPTAKSSLAIFWKICGEDKFLAPLLKDIEKEIGSYDKDPTRESNRIKKIFICAAYKAVAEKIKDEEKIQNYLSYAKDSGDWLGQPRIACSLSFLEKDPVSEEARSYLKANLGQWLSERRDEFIAIALLALGKEISRGELQRILEHVSSRADDLPPKLTALFLIGISQANTENNLPNKDKVEDKLYRAIRNRFKSAQPTDDEELIYAATALYLAKYHKISGYFEKYTSELKETLALKNSFTEATKKARTRNILLCMSLIAAISLACFIFFIPSLVGFKEDPSAVGKALLALNEQRNYALIAAGILVAYVLVSFLKKGDPVSGIAEYLKERFPGFLNLFKGDGRK
jgi:hypothetical protein